MEKICFFSIFFIGCFIMPARMISFPFRSGKIMADALYKYTPRACENISFVYHSSQKKIAPGDAERANEWSVRSLLLLHGSHHDGFHRSINSGRSLLLLLLAGHECGGGKSENGDVLHIGCLSWFAGSLKKPMYTGLSANIIYITFKIIKQA